MKVLLNLLGVNGACPGAGLSGIFIGPRRQVSERLASYASVGPTILHLLGFDHEEVTFTFQGRNFRLTDVEGKIVKKLLA